MAAILDFRSECFLIYKCYLPSFKSTGLLIQEKKRKIDFKDGGHLGFPIRTILATFDEQVTPKLSTKFQVKWPFGPGEEAKNRFSRWQPWPSSWISDRTSQRHAPYQVSSPFCSDWNDNNERRTVDGL